MGSTIKGITVKLGGDTTALKKNFDSLDKQSRNLQSELNKVNKALKFNPENTTLLAQKQEVLTEKITVTNKKLEELESIREEVEKKAKSGDLGAEEYRTYQREVEQTKSMLQRLEGELKNTETAFIDAARKSGEMNFSSAENKIDYLKGKFKDFSDSAEKSMENVSKKIETVGTGIENAGKTLSVGSAAAAGALGSGVKFAMDFEDTIAKVRTIADESAVPIDELRQQILDLSNETGVESIEIAQNVYDAISAGQNTADAVNFVRKSIALSKAGFADAGSSLDILTTIMNAYGLSADEVTQVSDTLIQTQNLGKVSVAQLAASMGKVIPTANSYGVKLDQLAAAYSITTAKGVAAAESTTYINAMLNELGKSGTKSSNILKEKTGRSFKELMDEGYSLSDVLSIVNDSANNQKLAFNDMWGTAEAAKAGVILLGDSASKFNDRLKEMNDSTGATDSAIDKLQTTSTKTKKVINELKNAGIELGDEVLEQAAPLLEDLMGGVKGLTDWLKKLNPEEKKTLTRALEIIAVVGPGVTIFGKLTKGVGSFVGTSGKLIKSLMSTTLAQEGLNAAMDANPIGAVTLAVTAFVAVLGGAITAINAFHDAQLADVGFTAQIESMNDTCERLTEIKNELNDTTVNFKQTVKEQFSDVGTIEEYKRQLDDLLDKAELSPAEQEQLVTIGDYFSQKYPEFDEAWNKYVTRDTDGKVQIKGNIKEIKDDLDSLIDNYKKVAAQNALMALSQENTENIVKSRAQVRDSAVDYITAKNEYDAFIKDWDLTEEKLYKLHSDQDWFTWKNKDGSKEVSVKDLKNQYKEMTDKLLTADKAYNEVSQSVAQLKVDGDDLSKMQAVLNGNYENAAAVMMAYNEGLINTTDIENSKYKSLDNLRKQAKEVAATTGENLVFGLTGGIDQYKGSVYASGISTANSYLEALKSQEGLDEHSPSKKTYQIGDDAAQGFINAISDKTDDVKNAAGTMASTTQNSAKISGWFGVGAGWISSAISGIFGKNKDAKSAGSSAANQVKSGAGGVSLFSTGTNLVSGFINGLKDGSTLSSLADAAKNIGSTVLNTIKKILGIASPSKEAEELGGFFGEGFAIGISEKNKQAQKAARNLADIAKEEIPKVDLSGTFNSLNKLSGIQPKIAENIRNITNAPVVQVRIENMNVSSDQDIDKLTKTVADKLGSMIIMEGQKWG